MLRKKSKPTVCDEKGPNRSERKLSKEKEVNQLANPTPTIEIDLLDFNVFLLPGEHDAGTEEEPRPEVFQWPSQDAQSWEGRSISALT